MKQKDVFFHSEGKAWLARNRSKITSANDPVLDALEQYKIIPAKVLEVGCANGWRLDALKKKYGCAVEGIEPGQSEKADSLVPVQYGTADDLISWRGETFDLVIYGFCLYLCDPEDYFHIVAEGDRVLKDGGHLVVYDFCSELPYKIPYKHKKGLFSHHYDFSRLWLGHPAYSLYGRTVQDETCVIILKKNLKNAFPEER